MFWFDLNCFSVNEMLPVASFWNTLSNSYSKMLHQYAHCLDCLLNFFWEFSVLLYVLKHEYSYVDVLKVMLIGQPIEMMVSSSKHCSAMWAFLQKGIGCQGQPICEVNIDGCLLPASSSAADPPSWRGEWSERLLDSWHRGGNRCLVRTSHHLGGQGPGFPFSQFQGLSLHQATDGDQWHCHHVENPNARDKNISASSFSSLTLCSAAALSVPFHNWHVGVEACRRWQPLPFPAGGFPSVIYMGFPGGKFFHTSPSWAVSSGAWNAPKHFANKACFFRSPDPFAKGGQSYFPSLEAFLFP